MVWTCRKNELTEFHTIHYMLDSKEMETMADQDYVGYTTLMTV